MHSIFLLTVNVSQAVGETNGVDDLFSIFELLEHDKDEYVKNE